MGLLVFFPLVALLSLKKKSCGVRSGGKKGTARHAQLYLLSLRHFRLESERQLPYK